MKIRGSLSMAIATAIGFWGATPDVHGQHAAGGGAGGLGALSGYASMGTGGAIGQSASGFGFGYAVSGGFSGYGMGNYGVNGWGQGSPNGGYYNPMMMNQAAMMNQMPMMGNGFPANMNLGQNGMMNNAGAGIPGGARNTPLAGAVPNGANMNANVNVNVNVNANPNAKASTRPGTSAKSKATKSRTKTTKKR